MSVDDSARVSFFAKKQRSVRRIVRRVSQFDFMQNVSILPEQAALLSSASFPLIK